VKHRFIAVTESEAHVKWLEESLGPLAEAVIADDVAPDRIAQLADAASGSVVFVRVSHADLRSRTELIRALLAKKPHLGVIGIGDEDDKEVILATVRAGARDFIHVGSERREAYSAFQRVFDSAPAQNPAPASGGKQIALLCSRPDIAASSFAVHLALRMVEVARREEKVLMIDLGVPAADSLLYLDVEPSYTFVDAVRSVRRFDQTLIETAFSRDRSGLALLPLLDDPGQIRDVNGNDMLALFSILKAHFNRTILYLGGLRSPDFLVQALSQADQVLLLADQSVANCSAARRLLDDLKDLSYPVRDIQLVLERYTEKLEPRAEKVAELLGLQLAAALPPNGLDIVRAMNSATNLFELAPQSPYVLGMQALVDQLLGRKSAAPPPSRGAALVERLRKLVARKSGAAA
jgi:pilus assembly protein CpaE